MFLVLFFFITSIPLAAVATALYLLVRRIRPTVLQVLVPAAAALVASIVYSLAFLPPEDANFFVGSLLGIAIHPLWVIAPFPLLKKYYTMIKPEYVVFISAVVVFTILFTMGAGADQFASGMAYVPPPSLLQETVDSLLSGLRDMALALLLYAAFFLLDVALRPEQGDGYGE
jgi:hypothetical protein